MALATQVRDPEAFEDLPKGATESQSPVLEGETTDQGLDAVARQTELERAREQFFLSVDAPASSLDGPRQREVVQVYHALTRACADQEVSSTKYYELKKQQLELDGQLRHALHSMPKEELENYRAFLTQALADADASTQESSAHESGFDQVVTFHRNMARELAEELARVETIWQLRQAGREGMKSSETEPQLAVGSGEAESPSVPVVRGEPTDHPPTIEPVKPTHDYEALIRKEQEARRLAELRHQEAMTKLEQELAHQTPEELERLEKEVEAHWHEREEEFHAANDQREREGEAVSNDPSALHQLTTQVETALMKLKYVSERWQRIRQAISERSLASGREEAGKKLDAYMEKLSVLEAKLDTLQDAIDQLKAYKGPKKKINLKKRNEEPALPGQITPNAFTGNVRTNEGTKEE